MAKLFENMNAADLPITEIDENAVVVMNVSDTSDIETTIHIKVGDETILIDPATILVSLERSIASDLWKSYYLPMYYQVSLVLSIMMIIIRTTYIRGLSVSSSMVISYFAESNSISIEYHGEKYVLSADSKKVTLKSKHPIRLLESPVFKVDSPMDTYSCYEMTSEVAEFIGQLSVGYSIFEQLQSIIGHAEERGKFLVWYKQRGWPKKK